MNATEGRAVLHMALRAPPEAGYRAGAEDASAEVHATLARMRDFAAAVHGGAVRGATGERFTDVLNIGIGGSDLGPAMAARALWTPAAPMRAHYLANVDAHAWEEMRPRLDPRAHAGAGRVEDLHHAGDHDQCRAWCAPGWRRRWARPGSARISPRCPPTCAATAAFGIAPERVFPFRDWVGGRFSLWSAIGLSLALALGWDAFARLLAGAHAMDRAFPGGAAGAQPAACCWRWRRSGTSTRCGYPARAVLPYDERLARLPAHLQQVEMESLGKRGDAGRQRRSARQTGPVVFGEPGTNAQHSFMQLLHQGTHAGARATSSWWPGPTTPHADSHRKLLANGLAQAEALMRGKDAEAVRAEMQAAGAG